MGPVRDRLWFASLAKADFARVDECVFNSYRTLSLTHHRPEPVPVPVPVPGPGPGPEPVPVPVHRYRGPGTGTGVTVVARPSRGPLEVNGNRK